MSIRRNPIRALLLAAAMAFTGQAQADVTLLNVSYDPTRELYRDVNAAFAEHWKEQTGETVTIRMSHGGSGKQARAVIDGLDADVVTLALEADIDAVAAKSGKIPADWRGRLDNNSSPYTSTIVFLVRKGNPKGITGWGDLVRGDVEVITPNPKTSGGARWNYLAAWAWADREYSGDEGRIRSYVAGLYQRVPVLDTGARGSLTTFAQRRIGDVLLAWENEAFLAAAEFGESQFDIVVPSFSILAEPPVTLVDGNVDAHGTREVAAAYLEFLYSEEGQRLAARHYYRPARPDLVPAAELSAFRDIDLISIDDPLFGGWAKAQGEHFVDGGVFDQIFRPGASN